MSSRSFQPDAVDRRGRSARIAEKLAANISERLGKEGAENILNEVYSESTSEEERKRSMVEIASAQLQAIHDLKMKRTDLQEEKMNLEVKLAETKESESSLIAELDAVDNRKVEQVAEAFAHDLKKTENRLKMESEPKGLGMS